jgi:hypothetical protein
MSDLAQEVRRLAPWYHTFELPGGVVTDGYFDLRGVVGSPPGLGALVPGSFAPRKVSQPVAAPAGNH